jgi:hypothetical protein
VSSRPGESGEGMIRQTVFNREESKVKGKVRFIVQLDNTYLFWCFYLFTLYMFRESYLPSSGGALLHTGH